MAVRSLLLRIVPLTLLLWVSGCGEGERPSAYPVSGHLFIEGQPAARAQIAFHPMNTRQVSRPVAITEPDGSFHLMTYAAGDGAPQGEYVVTIFWRDEKIPFDECAGDDLKKHDRLCGLYLDSRTSVLRATVQAGSNDLVLWAQDLSALLRKPQAHSPPGASGETAPANGESAVSSRRE
jgi:hypothetical protein